MKLFYGMLYVQLTENKYLMEINLLKRLETWIDGVIMTEGEKCCVFINIVTYWLSNILKNKYVKIKFFLYCSALPQTQSRTVINSIKNLLMDGKLRVAAVQRAACKVKVGKKIKILKNRDIQCCDMK